MQVYSYEDTRIIKAFPQILKVSSRCAARRTGANGQWQVLYNKDCISDQAIIYWHQKGSKPQGRQHFLNATASLVKVSLPRFGPCMRFVLTDDVVPPGAGERRGRVVIALRSRL